MKSTLGKPRALTDAQVQTILAWHDEVLAWRDRRRAIKTKKQFAKSLGVADVTLTRMVARGPDYRCPRPENRTPGRPPLLGDSTTIAAIHAWHAQFLELKALRRRIGTQEQLAAQFGVSPKTVAQAVARGGEYKQASPEKRSAELARRHERIARLRERNLF